MKGDLFINGLDAKETYGIEMGEGFLDAIGASLSLKGFIENKSRNRDGKDVIYNNPKVDDREISLTFNLEGDSEGDYKLKKRAFEQILYAGRVLLYVPVNEETYRLTYLKSASFAQNTNRTFCKMAVKFNEPNPANRMNE